MIVNYYHLEKENNCVLKFHVDNYSYFEISPSLQKAPHLKALKLNMRQRQLLQEIQNVPVLIAVYIIWMINPISKR